jgi:hypothetical protein
MKILKKFIVDNAPAIFTGLAVAGVIETVALTAKAAVNVVDDIYDLRSNIRIKPEPEAIDYIDACWKDCVPPALSLTATIFFILAANQAHIRTEAGLAAAYSLYEGKYKDYKAKNKELFGEKADEKVEEEVRRDNIRKTEPLYPGRSEEYLVYDEVTRQYFYSTYKEKEHAQEQLNRILGKESAVSYNYLLSMFKQAEHRTKIGNIFGWFLDDTFADYYYWNESFYGRPYAELTFEPSGEVTDQQEEIFILRCSLEPIAENNMDDSEAMDSQDLHAS